VRLTILLSVDILSEVVTLFLTVHTNRHSTSHTWMLHTWPRLRLQTCSGFSQYRVHWRSVVKCIRVTHRGPTSNNALVSLTHTHLCIRNSHIWLILRDVLCLQLVAVSRFDAQSCNAAKDALSERVHAANTDHKQAFRPIVVYPEGCSTDYILKRHAYACTRSHAHKNK
jgi:hypothetical protein